MSKFPTDNPIYVVMARCPGDDFPCGYRTSYKGAVLLAKAVNADPDPFIRRWENAGCLDISEVSCVSIVEMTKRTVVKITWVEDEVKG